MSSLSVLIHVFVAAVHDHASHSALGGVLLVSVVSRAPMHADTLYSCAAATESKRCSAHGGVLMDGGGCH